MPRADALTVSLIERGREQPPGFVATAAPRPSRRVAHAPVPVSQTAIETVSDLRAVCECVVRWYSSQIAHGLHCTFDVHFCLLTRCTSWPLSRNLCGGRIRSASRRAWRAPGRRANASEGQTDDRRSWLHSSNPVRVAARPYNRPKSDPHRRHSPRPVRDPLRPRGGRHGRGLSRARCAARARRCDQGPAGSVSPAILIAWPASSGRRRCSPR